MRYFLISIKINHGDYEYYDRFLVRTKMKNKQLDSDHKDWKQNFLACHYGYITLDECGWWDEGYRIVSVNSYEVIHKDDVESLRKHFLVADLEVIIADGVETFEHLYNFRQLVKSRV